MKVLVTGAGGLIGSETAKFYSEKGASVVGIDNNMRRYFFGEGGSVSDNLNHLKAKSNQFKNHGIDIRDRAAVVEIYKKDGPFDLVVHTAAQPSHDWAAREPMTDFDINAVGSLNVLEGFRLYSPKGVFIFTSTNKVYGDKPNEVALTELDKRHDYDKNQTLAGVSSHGISERMSVDSVTHSVFGASKLAADVLSQEYGRYFGLKIGIFRGGCLTGPQHAAVELHGFLAYIVHCAVLGKPYTIFGYKGKQVRDQIHSKDVVTAFEEFRKKPGQGVVYNLGGGKQNSASVLEVIDILKDRFSLNLNYALKDQNRIGDHICYYSDMRKFKKDYPNWKMKYGLVDIIKELINSSKR